MKTFVATIGYTEWPIASAIIKHGLSEGDRIFLLTPEKKDERSKSAVDEVKSFISKFAPKVEVSEIPVSIHNPVDSISALAKLIAKEAAQRRDLIVNLSGGMKVLVIETVLALTLIQVENLIVELKTEDKIDLQIPRVWGVLQEVSPEEKQTLKIMSKQTSFSLSNLAKALKISTATSHRLSERLERIGAITSKKIGKERVMELTDMGKILATIEEEM